MQLAEALIERADLQKRIEQLRSRIAMNARYQEGAEPEEDAAVLLDEAESVTERLEALIGRINATNAVTLIDGVTVTALLARRDALRIRHALVTGAADAAAGEGGHRQLRSELRTLTALPVAQLRARADDLARRLRELEAVLQRANWEVRLVD